MWQLVLLWILGSMETPPSVMYHLQYVIQNFKLTQFYWEPEHRIFVGIFFQDIPHLFLSKHVSK